MIIHIIKFRLKLKWSETTHSSIIHNDILNLANRHTPEVYIVSKNGTLNFFKVPQMNRYTFIYQLPIFLWLMI